MMPVYCCILRGRTPSKDKMRRFIVFRVTLREERAGFKRLDSMRGC